MAQVVEHVLGKDEVTSSNLVSSSKESIVVERLRCFLVFPGDLVLRRECGGGLGRSPIIIFGPRKSEALLWDSGHRFEAG